MYVLRIFVVCGAGLFFAALINAANFFAPAVRDGELPVKLHPTEGLGTTASRVVTFGIPFPRGSVLPSELWQIRVLNAAREEIAAYVEAQTPWRHAVDSAKNDTSIRVVRIQIVHAPTVVHPNFDTVYIEWGRSPRTLNRAMVNPRTNWHPVTSGTFQASDNVFEPDVFAVLPGSWMSRGLLRAGRMDSFDSVVAETRDSPATMDATQQYGGYLEMQYASKNFFYTAINEWGSDTPPSVSNQNPYRTDDEPWLYDRASAFYSLYQRSGFSRRFARRCVRRSSIDCSSIRQGLCLPVPSVRSN
jgi:hypothetical protein